MEVQEIKEQLKEIFRTVINNDKWITIHPHGEDSDDYRRIKLEDGETPKEAIDRTYGKKDKEGQAEPKEHSKEWHEQRYNNRINALKLMLTQIKESPDYNAEHARDTIQKLLKSNQFNGYKFDIDKDDFIKEGHGDALAYIGQIYGKENGDRNKKQDAGFKLLQDIVRQDLSNQEKEWLGIKADTKDGSKDISKEEHAKIKEQVSKMSDDELVKAHFESQKGYESETPRAGSMTKHEALKDYHEEQAKDKKEEPKEPESPFGEGVKAIEGKKGIMGGKTYGYVKGDKGVSIEEYRDGSAFKVNYYNGTRLKDIKYYSTKKGMEKAVKSHLQGDNKEAKALETKTDLNTAEAKYKEVLKRYNENDRKRWSSGLSNAEYHKAWEEAEKAKKELTTARREYAESIMANFETVESNPYEEKQAARRERYEELSDKASRESEQAHQAFRDKMSAIPFGQPILVGHHSEQRDRRYREKAWDTLGKAVKLSDKANYYESKANSVGKAGISADDANAIAKLARKYKSGVTSAEKRRIIDRVIDIHKNRQMAGDTSKQTDYSNLGFQVERNTDINRLQLKFDGKPEANIRSILKSNGFRWSPREGAWQRQLGGNSESGLNRVVEQLKNINNSLLDGLDEILKQDDFTPDELKIINCINEILDPTVNNNKEQDMALLEEIKKLITKVENGKESDMEEKIENAKVDKRDIIRQIMAIAGKEEASEDVKTIAKLAEKLAYDKSEAGTADNEMDKENPDDEKEVKEVKEEIKEDVENKCKNSVDNSKTDYFAEMNKIYNAAQEAKKENIYISQAQREQDAVDYFKK